MTNDEIYQMYQMAVSQGVYFRKAGLINDLIVNLSGREFVSFVKMSTLGIDAHPQITTAIKNALEYSGYGRHSSRLFIDTQQFIEAEKLLAQIFGGPTLVTRSIGDASIALMTSLIGAQDAIVLDKSVHLNVHHAAAISTDRGAHKVLTKHQHFNETIQLISTLSKTKRHVWFCSDGIYSMSGAFLPTDFYNQILDIAPNVYLYVDDAHGTSWTGVHGCGHFLSRIKRSDRIVVAQSLNKAFGATGGCLIFNNSKLRDYVYKVGARHYTSHCLYTIDLAAIIASAQIHLSEEIYHLQNKLQEKNNFLIKQLEQEDIPLYAQNNSPIHSIVLGANKRAINFTQKVQEDGFLLGCALFPIVTKAKALVRICTNINHTEQQLVDLCHSISKHYKALDLSNE